MSQRPRWIFTVPPVCVRIEAMTQIQLRPARPSEEAAISDVAMRCASIAHWEYDDDFLLACRPELTIAPEQCDGIRLVVAERQEAILSFYRLSGKPPEGTLEALFVDEPMIGCGLGRLLFDDAVARARRLGPDRPADRRRPRCGAAPRAYGRRVDRRVAQWVDLWSVPAEATGLYLIMGGRTGISLWDADVVGSDVDHDQGCRCDSGMRGSCSARRRRPGRR